MDHLPPHRTAAPTRPPRSRSIRLAVGLLVAALLLAGCNLLDEVLPGGPAFTVTPTSVALEAEVGQRDSATLTIANTGETSLTVAVTTDASSLTLGTGTLQVAAGANRDVTISLACSTEGDTDATVSFTDGTDTVAVDVALSCTPSTNTAFDVAPTSLSLSAQVGNETSETLTVTNTSGGELTVTLTSDAAALSLDPSGLTIADGAQATATATLDCTSELSVNATVAVSDGSDTSVVAAELDCLGATADTVFLVGEASESETVARSVTLTAPSDAASFTASDDAAWLDVQPTSGSASGGTVTLDVAQTCGTVRDVQQGTVTVTFGGGISVDFDVFRVCVPAPPNDFDVRLAFSGEGFTAAAVDAFVDAAVRWEQISTSDITPLTPSSTTGCATGVPDRGGVEIDDILIDARVEFIDGPSGILGSAGPCIVRSSTDPNATLPAYGTMRFDSADVADLIADGNFDETILHEMGHVLGIGTLWDNAGLLDFESDPSTDPCRLANAFTTPPTFTGAGAVSEWQSLGGSGAVPVENEYGAGTQCGHWDEETFDNELMTGFLDGGASSNPLAELTITSLADLGYGVDLSQAESYTLPACSPTCLHGDEAHGLDIAAREILLYPIYEIGPDGEQRRLPGAPTR